MARGRAAISPSAVRRKRWAQCGWNTIGGDQRKVFQFGNEPGGDVFWKRYGYARHGSRGRQDLDGGILFSGRAFTVGISRNSSSFTHTVSVKVNGVEVASKTGVGNQCYIFRGCVLLCGLLGAWREVQCGSGGDSHYLYGQWIFRKQHRKQDGFRNGIDRRAEWTELRGCCKRRGAACDHGISQRRICAYTGIFFSR